MRDEAPYYEIGYKKPPKQFCFSKGTSGNPRGRPRGSQNMAALFGKELNSKVSVKDSEKGGKITLRHAIVKRICFDAAKGNHRAAAHILKMCAPDFEIEKLLSPLVDKKIEEIFELLPNDLLRQICEFIEKANANGSKNVVSVMPRKADISDHIKPN